MNIESIKVIPEEGRCLYKFTLKILFSLFADGVYLEYIPSKVIIVFPISERLFSTSLICVTE
jgi:hypothetical protein